MLDCDGLEYGKSIERFKALFAAMTTGLDAAERQLDAAAGTVIVDEYLTAADGACHAHLTAAVAGPDAGDQTEIGAIGQRDRIGFIVERHGCQYWAKYFFLGQSVPGRHVTQQRGHLIKARRWRAVVQFSLRHDSDAVDAGFVQKTGHACLLAFANQWTAIQIHRR